LQAVQRQVNTEHRYRTDQSGYNVGDHWAIMGEGDSGDCEDFALTKMQMLLDAGYAAKNLQLATGITETGQGHAFLLVQTVNRGTLVLDNRYQNIMQLVNVPYRVETYQLAGQTWASFTTRLDDVAIEYMNCDALAFADGDSVIVKFESQEWNNPKVVGFKSNPASCPNKIFIVQGVTSAPTEIFAFLYNRDTDAYSQSAIYAEQAVLYASCEAINGNVYYFGGRVPGLVDPVSERYLFKNYNIKYSIGDDTWTKKTDMDVKRAWTQCFSIVDNLFVLCGSGSELLVYVGYGDQIFYDRNDQYTPSTDTWQGVADHPLELTYFSTFVLSEKGYTIGGRYGGSLSQPFTNRNIEYDPVSNSYIDRLDLDRNRYGLVTFADRETGKGYIVGGDNDPKFDSYSRSFWNGWLTERNYEYDPVGNNYTRKQDWNNDGYLGFFNDPPGEWVVDYTLNTGNDGDGPFQIPSADGYGIGTIFQTAVYTGAPYNVVPPQNFIPSTDTWEVKDLMPLDQFYNLDWGTACAL